MKDLGITLKPKEKRTTCIRDNIEIYLNTIFTKFRTEFDIQDDRINYLRVDLNAVESALKDYSDNLLSWKSYFHCERLDRHKVAAITAYYLLKRSPLILFQQKDVIESSGFIPIIDELCTFEVAINKLENNGKPYNIPKSVMGSYIQSFRAFRVTINTTESVAQGYKEQFVLDLSRSLYQLEALHLESTKHPD